ncbi:hypothetical protein PFISCL1PPCAC_6910, partial [Pristionchus fissidentatus]
SRKGSEARKCVKMLVQQSVLLILSMVYFVASLECKRQLPRMCTTCCALLYDNDDCETDNLFRVKWDADGFLGRMWEGQARAVEVYPGCLLTLWEQRNQTGQSRVLGLDGVNVHYLDRYAFSRRAASLACKCTSAAGPAPVTTTAAPAAGAAESEQVDLPDSPPIEVPVVKESADSDSGYGSDSEQQEHLEEVKSLEDMGIPEEEEKKDEDTKEDDSREVDESSENPSTTVLSGADGADAGSDSQPAPSDISVPSLSYPITELTMTPPIREIPLTIERISMPASDKNHTL